MTIAATPVPLAVDVAELQHQKWVFAVVGI